MRDMIIKFSGYYPHYQNLIEMVGMEMLHLFFISLKFGREGKRLELESYITKTRFNYAVDDTTSFYWFKDIEYHGVIHRLQRRGLLSVVVEFDSSDTCEDFEFNLQRFMRRGKIEFSKL